MKQSEQRRNALIQMLSDGEFHSGERIGEELGLSRAAVSKHINYLSELGLDIFRVTGKGYRLAKPLTLLKRDTIASELVEASTASFEILNIIDSTNERVKNLRGTLENGFCCLAEAQTAGRGRHGRTWVSPFGASLYLTMYWSFEEGYQAIGGLSLVVGVAIAECLSEAGVKGCQLKWPNDVYLNHKKLAGILIEVEGQMDSQCDCIIGVGLNIDLGDGGEAIDQPWTDLASGGFDALNRNQLAARLMAKMRTAMQSFAANGLGDFIPRWQQLDLFADKPVRLVIGDKQIEGIGRGVNASGAFMLEQNGQTKPFYGGEISVRPQ